MPENKSLYEISGETQKLLNHIDPIDNKHLHYPEIDDVAKQNVDVDFYNIDRLNTVNKKRLHGLADIKKNTTRPSLDELDKELFNFLDRESTLKVQKQEPFSDKSNQNEILHRDILKKYDAIAPEQFKDPLNQYEKVDGQVEKIKKS